MNRVKLYRVVKGIKWWDLVKQTGISTMRLWEMQNGYREPTDQEAIRLAEVFGLGALGALKFSKENMEIPDEKILEL